MQLHQEDLSFTSDVTLLIQKTQSQLKKHTLALKYGGKLLTEQVADLEDEEKNNELSDINKKWRSENGDWSTVLLDFPVLV